jgi:hypothetical protein
VATTPAVTLLAVESAPATAAVEPAHAVAEPARLYRLTGDGGQYLRKDGLTLTRDVSKAWKGTAQQYEAIFKRQPQWKSLDPVRAP